MKPIIAVPLGVGGILAAIGTTIANANGLFAGHPSLAYWFWAAAIAMVAVAVIGWITGANKKSTKQSEPTPAHAPISIHLENIGNPIQKQSNDQRTSLPPPPVPTYKVRLPEVKPLPSRVGRLDDFIQFSGSTPMLLLPFRNDSVVGQDLEFSAHIIYLDAEGKETADVARGTWFPVTQNPLRTDFETGMTRELAVLFFANQQPFKPVIHWHKEAFHRNIIRLPELWPQADVINKAIAIVEVRLLSGDNEPIVFSFDLVADSAIPFPSLVRRK